MACWKLDIGTPRYRRNCHLEVFRSKMGIFMKKEIKDTLQTETYFLGVVTLRKYCTWKSDWLKSNVFHIEKSSSYPSIVNAFSSLCLEFSTKNLRKILKSVRINSINLDNSLS